MDIFTIYLPIAEMEFNIILLVAIGFCVGTLGGFFGVGGAWIVTPALNIFGFKMAFAIGTDLAHIFGKSIIATKKHAGMGNVDWRLGLFSIAASVIGIEIGKRMVLALERAGNVGDVVRWVYMVFLFGLGLYMLYDYVSAMKRMRREGGEAPSGGPVEVTSPAAIKLHKINLPPHVSLPTSGIDRISFWVIFSIFLLTGFLSGFMGVGGGFIAGPMMFITGVPMNFVVGTDLAHMTGKSIVAARRHRVLGHVDVKLGFIMIIGTIVGVESRA